MAKKYSSWVGKKIKKIAKEGIRRNTKEPVSKANPRRKVSRKQMIAVAKNRCITVADCNRKVGDRINIKITENKNNIYLAEMV